jgi:hypothetical protein
MERKDSGEIGYVPSLDDEQTAPVKVGRRSFLLRGGALVGMFVTGFALDRWLTAREDPSGFWGRPVDMDSQGKLFFTSSPTVYTADFTTPPEGIIIRDNFPVDAGQVNQLTHETRVPLFSSPQVGEAGKTVRRENLISMHVQLYSGEPYELWKPGQPTSLSGTRVVSFDDYLGPEWLRISERRGNVGVGLYGRIVDLSGKPTDELGASGEWFVPLPYFGIVKDKKK